MANRSLARAGLWSLLLCLAPLLQDRLALAAGGGVGDPGEGFLDGVRRRAARLGSRPGRPSEPASEAAKEVAAKLSSVPLLRGFVLELLEDSQVPLNLKRVVLTALLREEAVVLKLTEKVRREFGLMPELRAATLFNLYGFRTVSGTQAPPTLNQAVQAPSAAGPVDGKPTVLIEQRRRAENGNDLMILMHELAHVRFLAFMERRIGRLADRLPEGQVRRAADGKYEMNVQLWDFLFERYAYQIEYETFLATNGRYYSELLGRFGPDVDSSNYRRAVADYVAHAYRITDPAVVSLRDRSLLEILLGADPTASQ
ncbi:MAG: hypothetical protein HY554_02640 [Elusimicrobia bacterium]|nr:hypothetical protein [Elusimicrobiota bacterium]